MYFDLEIELFMVFIGKKVEIVGINFLLNILCSVYYYFVYISLNIKGKMVNVLCCIRFCWGYYMYWYIMYLINLVWFGFKG